MNTLIKYLKTIPAVNSQISFKEYEDGLWWVKFRIDPNHKNSWKVVQELAHAINYLSIEENLPIKFYPVSPPPFSTGGPEEFLSWIIDNSDSDYTPEILKDWLEGRLPDVNDDLEDWK